MSDPVWMELLSTVKLIAALCALCYLIPLDWKR